jgi:hypothetical protein
MMVSSDDTPARDVSSPCDVSFLLAGPDGSPPVTTNHLSDVPCPPPQSHDRERRSADGMSDENGGEESIQAHFHYANTSRPCSAMQHCSNQSTALLY